VRAYPKITSGFAVAAAGYGSLAVSPRRAGCLAGPVLTALRFGPAQQFLTGTVAAQRAVFHPQLEREPGRLPDYRPRRNAQHLYDLGAVQVRPDLVKLLLRRQPLDPPLQVLVGALEAQCLGRSASVKAGWIMTRAVVGAAVVIGYLPAGLRPGKLGQLQVPAIERKPNVSPLASHTTSQPAGKLGDADSPDTSSLPILGAWQPWRLLAWANADHPVLRCRQSDKRSDVNREKPRQGT
jgi:hypothetical protein